MDNMPHLGTNMDQPELPKGYRWLTKGEFKAAYRKQGDETYTKHAEIQWWSRNNYWSESSMGGCGYNPCYWYAIKGEADVWTPVIASKIGGSDD